MWTGEIISQSSNCIEKMYRKLFHGVGVLAFHQQNNFSIFQHQDDRTSMDNMKNPQLSGCSSSSTTTPTMIYFMGWSSGTPIPKIFFGEKGVDSDFCVQTSIISGSVVPPHPK